MPNRNQPNRPALLARWLTILCGLRNRTCPGRQSAHSRLVAWWFVAVVVAGVMPFTPARADSTEERHALHYAPNHNFAPDGTYAPARGGFNLADVSRPRDVARLGSDVSVLVWVGLCHGVDEAFVRIVNTYARTPRLFGFYLMDDPDPRPTAPVTNAAHACSVANLRAEADWIHAHVPSARTVIVIMNLGDASHPSFRGSYEPTQSHVDLFGLAAYPCRTELKGWALSTAMLPPRSRQVFRRIALCPSIKLSAAAAGRPIQAGTMPCRPCNRPMTSCPVGAS